MAFYALGGTVAVIYILATSAVVFTATHLMQLLQDNCDKCIVALKNTNKNNNSSNNCTIDESRYADKTFPTPEVKEHPTQKLPNKKGSGTLSLDIKTQKNILKNNCKNKKKAIVTLALLATFGTLAILKYTNFIMGFISGLLPNTTWGGVDFFIPLGISFYTFSAASYLFDIYNNKYRAQSNPLKVLLCMSYFPSIVQGPINRFNDLQKEFFSEDALNSSDKITLKNTQFAIQRILWGMVKKLVIADRAAQVVGYIFSEYERLPWFAILLGLVMYCVQLYGDFAGGLDIALGASQLFGVRLKENFRQPYFSQSISEFWRRWHITLGTWMRDYIFYPFSLSRAAMKLGRAMPNKHLKRVVPAAVANILIFLIVGIWHGASAHFIVYGFYFGFIIAFSVIAEPLYKKLIEKFHINTKTFYWRVFRTVRTFILVTLAGLLDYVTNITQSIGMTKQLFNITNGVLWKNFDFYGFGRSSLLWIAVFCALWFIVSLIEERGNGNIYEYISKKPLVIRWVIYIMLILVPAFLKTENNAGFMYAAF